MPGHSVSVLSLGTLLLTSTTPVIFLYPPLTGCELNQAALLGSTFLILEFLPSPIVFGTTM
jgi:hypothetical protein